MSDPETAPAKPPANWHRRIRLTLVAMLALVVVGAGIGAFTGVNAFGRMMWHGHGMWNDPAKVGEGVERMVKHFAVEIDMTEDQRRRLTKLAQAAAGDLLPLRQTMHDAGRDATGLLTAAIIDRDAIEVLRAAKLRSLEQASARLSRFLADAAEVLSVDQRRELAERIADHRRHHRRGRDD